MGKILNVYRVANNSTKQADDVCIVVFNHVTVANEIRNSVIVGDAITPVNLPSLRTQNAPAHFITTAADLARGVYECVTKNAAPIVVNSFTDQEITIGEYEDMKSALISELCAARVMIADDEDSPQVAAGLDLIGILNEMNDRDRKSISDKLAEYKRCLSDWRTKPARPSITVGEQYGLNFVATRHVVDNPRKFIGVSGSAVRSQTDGQLYINSIVSGNISYTYQRDKHFIDIVSTWLDSLSDELRAKIGFRYGGNHAWLSNVQFAKYIKPGGEEAYVRWNVAEEIFKRATIASADVKSLTEEHDALESSVLGVLNAIRLECCGSADTQTIGQLIEIYRKLPVVVSMLGTVSGRSTASALALNQITRELRSMIDLVENVFNRIDKSGE